MGQGFIRVRSTQKPVPTNRRNH